MKIYHLIIAILVAMIPSAGRAEECRVQDVEGGLYLGPTFPLGAHKGGHSKTLIVGGLSVGYNLPKVPVDVGLYAQLDAVSREYNLAAIGLSHLSSNEQVNVTLSLGAQAHYNFHRCEKVNPFVGLGLGVAFNSDNATIMDSGGTSFAVMPKVGVEFWQIFRLTGYAMICRKGYNSLGITVGVSFGGRVKKD